jgi:hypothetical protein
MFLHLFHATEQQLESWPLEQFYRYVDYGLTVMRHREAR